MDYERTVKYQVSWVDKKGSFLEAKCKIFSSLEDATDHVYKVEHDYGSLVTTSSDYFSRCASSIEIEKITTELFFKKDIGIRLEDGRPDEK